MFVKKNAFNFILLQIIFSICGNLSNAADMPDTTDLSTLKRVVVELYKEEKVDFISHAKNLSNRICEELQKSLDTLRDRNINEKKEILKLYYPFYETKENIRDATLFMEADMWAWRILFNSLNFYQNEKNQDLVPIFNECLRVFCSSGQDLSVSSQGRRCCPAYMYNRFNASADLLSSILCALDLQSDIPLSECKNELLKFTVGLNNGENWYFRIFLISCLQTGDEETQSLLEIDEETVEHFKKAPSIQLSSHLFEDLRKTELFKILDCKERKKRNTFQFHNLINYHIYLKDLDAYLSSCSSEIASGLLASQTKRKQSKRKTKNKNNKKSKDEGKGKKRQHGSSKGSSSQVKKQSGSSNRAMELIQTKSFQEKIRESSNSSPAPCNSDSLTLISSPVFQGEREAESALEGKVGEEREEVGKWTLVKPKVRQPRIKASTPLVRLTWSDLKSLCQNNRLHYKDYALVRHIIECPQSIDTYSYNQKSCAFREKFELLRKTINEENSLKFIDYLCKQKGHHNIRLPNIAGFFITFHILKEGESIEYTFYDNDIYLSGAQTFQKDDAFQLTNHIKLAYHDALTQEEQGAYWKTEEIRQLFLKVKMLDKIFNNLVQGRWLFNALDSEPLLLLDLQKTKLLTYLNSLSSFYSDFEIQGAVIGISSLYECCFRCRNLLQGFQWKLESTLRTLIEEMKLEERTINLSPCFNSMVLFNGQLRIKHSEDLLNKRCVVSHNEPPHLDSTNTRVNQQHKLVLFQLDS